MGFKNLNREEKWIFAGIPVLFLVGSFFHLFYKISGNNPVVALFCPINESIWEHTKMVVLPVILWWSLYYLFNNRNIDENKWFLGEFIALVVSIITIPLIFYFYTEAFGISSLIIDISILLLALIFGQTLGLHFYRYSKGINANKIIVFYIAIILMYMIFTVYPPNIPIFIG